MKTIADHLKANVYWFDDDHIIFLRKSIEGLYENWKSVKNKDLMKRVLELSLSLKTGNNASRLLAVINITDDEFAELLELMVRYKKMASFA